MDSSSWYAKLNKPKWAPTAGVFGPVWSLLYILIAASFGYVFIQFVQGNLSWSVALPFMLNLLFNFAFTPLQFGLKNNFLAAVDILLVLITLIWALIVIAPQIPWVAYVNIPYLLWVGFATALQLEITRLNR